ncbi:MAG: VWA domain-containing protein [Deltaproteobacteria bacterium]|nr:MAG: VWA domain-containing protein [Deltaproteobacteria bacterium]
MRSSGLAPALIACALVHSSPAAADEFSSPYGGEFREVSHRVAVAVRDGYATFRVRRALRNVGGTSDELWLSARLPMGGAVTAVRARTARRWRAARLADADDAVSRFEALADLVSDGRRGRDLPVLVAWEADGVVSVRASPVARRATVEVEYEVVAPVCWAAGRGWLAYPVRAQAEFADPTITVDPGPGRRATVGVGAAAAAPFVDDAIGACGAGVGDGDRDVVAIAIDGPSAHPATVRYAVAPLASGRALVRIDVDAASALGRAPRRPWVVFVVDGSYSADDDGLTRQLALARGYLAHAPDARVEVVVFRREAERLFGRFVAASSFDDAVARAPAGRRALGNGSRPDRGLALAANLLSTQRGPKRIVLVTDGLAPDAFSVDAALAALAPLPADAVVHALRVDRWEDEPLSEGRDDDGPLAAIAAAHGGVQLALVGMPGDDPATTDVMAGIVRPVRIDDLRVVASDGTPFGDVDVAVDQLAEGSASRDVAIVAAAPRAIRVEGKLWSRRWSTTVSPDVALSAALPALGFGSDLHWDLGDRDGRALAQVGGVVSPHTSYLVDPGALTPLPPDVDAMLQAGYGVTCRAGCTASASVTCSGTLTSIVQGQADDGVDRAALIADRLAPAVARCAALAGEDRVDRELVVETTVDEIVGVDIDGESGDGAGECLVDAAWQVRLPAAFVEPHARWVVPIHYAGAGWRASPAPARRP